MTTVLDPTGLLPAHAATYHGHTHRHGPLPDLDAHTIRTIAADSAIIGHGGAGFPLHRKLDTVATGHHPIVIGNAAESEPGSHKDHALLDRSPHLVLDGLTLATRAVGATETHLYAPAGTHGSIRTALAERPDLHITVHTAPGHFTAGEETAVIAAITGKPAHPTDKRVRVTDHGLHGRPTLVQNIETLAHLALAARYGPTWYRSRGTTTEPGTFLATLTGPIRHTGVYETAYGTPLGHLLDRAGGPTRPHQALLIGGYHGAWVPADDTIALSRTGLAPYGATPGAGVIIALGAGECGLLSTARIVTYLAGQTAGQCGPCINGLPRIAESFAALAHRTARPGLVTEIDRLARVVTGRGACKHPDGTARLVRSSLHVFRRETDAHLAGRCTATEGGTR